MTKGKLEDNMFWLQNIFNVYLYDTINGQTIRLNTIDNAINTLKESYFQDNADELTVLLCKIIVCDKDVFTKHLLAWEQERTGISHEKQILSGISCLYHAERFRIQQDVGDDKVVSEETVDMIKSSVKKAVLETVRTLYNEQKDNALAQMTFHNALDTLSEEEKTTILNLIETPSPKAFGHSAKEKGGSSKLKDTLFRN